MTLAAPTLRPGDPPPFWDGPWHPQGLTDGAVQVKPLTAGEAHAFPAFPVSTTLTATVPKAAEPVAVPPAPSQPARPEPAAAQAPAEPVAPPPQPQVQPAQPAAAAPAQPAAPTAPAQPAAAPQGPSSDAPAQPRPPAPAPPRSYVTSLFSQGPIRPAPGVPELVDQEMTAQFRAYAKQLQGEGKFGEALQGLNEALRRSPGEASTYAALGNLMLGGKAWEDAAHHFLIAYMLAPKELTHARMTLHAAWVLGYVGWAYQIAMAIHKVQPAPDVAEIGRAAQGWLQNRQAAVTALCPSCRHVALTPAPGPCQKCGAACMGSGVNAAGFQGLKLLQQTAPTGRLFAGASCHSCKTDTVLLVTRGGPKCLSCQGPALASM
jgi:hypothetical protein